MRSVKQSNPSHPISDVSWHSSKIVREEIYTEFWLLGKAQPSSPGNEKVSKIEETGKNYGYR